MAEGAGKLLDKTKVSGMLHVYSLFLEVMVMS